MTHYTVEDIARIEQESLDQIVYLGFTKRELSAAFTRVENKENWKFPIDTILPGDTAVAELNKIIAAISFFAGSETKIIWASEGWRIEAPGYYRSVGA